MTAGISDATNSEKPCSTCATLASKPFCSPAASWSKVLLAPVSIPFASCVAACAVCCALASRPTMMLANDCAALAPICPSPAAACSAAAPMPAAPVVPVSAIDAAAPPASSARPASIPTVASSTLAVACASPSSKPCPSNASTPGSSSGAAGMMSPAPVRVACKLAMSSVMASPIDVVPPDACSSIPASAASRAAARACCTPAA